MDQPGADIAISVVGLTKRYGGTTALEDLSLESRRGEILCLLGENGAGKSTLVRLLTGIEAPSAGTIAVRGEVHRLSAVSEAQRLGIGVVHQHPIVFPDLSIAENIFAGRQPRLGGGKWPLVDFREMRRRTRSALDEIGLAVPETASMASLTAGQRQLVEIAKALSQDVDILILDEPTASLSPGEAATLFDLLRRLRSRGVAIILISHRLAEILEIADRVTVLRDGRHVGTKPIAEITQDILVSMMVGRPIAARKRNSAKRGEAILSVTNWQRRGVFSALDLTLHRGEIVGMAGLLGAGRSEFARSLVGIEPHDGGELRIAGRVAEPRSPRQMLDLGVAYVTEDRQGSGLLLDWPVVRNMSLAVVGRLASGKTWLSSARERSLAEKMVDDLQVRPAAPQRKTSALSGGNQQKVLLAKWLAARPSVLILDEPTAGVDVGAKDEVHALIRQLATEGAAVLVISSDLPEILAVTDRIIVLADGRISGELETSSASEPDVMRLATSGRRPNAA